MSMITVKNQDYTYESIIFPSLALVFINIAKDLRSRLKIEAIYQYCSSVGMEAIFEWIQFVGA